MKVRGFFRVQITQDVDGKPTLVGDSGWRQNQVTNLGFNQYLVSALGSISGSKYVSHMAVGTGGAPAASDTTLTGEQSVRAAVTAATSSGSKTVRFTATFDSAASFVTATKNLSNIGLFNTSTAAGGTLFAGNTYTSSAVATNQNVSILRQLLVTGVRKLREVGEHLIEITPSRALFREGVETMYEAPARVEEIVRTAWRHAEQGRNALALAWLGNNLETRPTTLFSRSVS